MGFNRNDLQDDDDFNFDDDDFKFDDKPNGDDFKFDDDAPDIDLDDGKDSGFGFENEDMPELNDGGTAPPRTNRTFIYIAALMIILFLLGLGAVLFLATQNQGPTPGQLTATAIVATNNAVQVLLNQTSTAAVDLSVAQTQTASVPTATPTPIPPTREPTVTPTTEPPTVDATQAFANALLTQVANEATQTAAAALITPTVAAPDQNAVAATGTAWRFCWVRAVALPVTIRRLRHWRSVKVAVSLHQPLKATSALFRPNCRPRSSLMTSARAATWAWWLYWRSACSV